MFVSYNGMNIKLPDFLIVGAAKSGTTSLHYYLKQHPQIFMPKRKELWFFSFMDASLPSGDLKDFAVLTVSDYAEYFKDAKDNQVFGEACPTYLYTYKDTIKNIKKVYGEKYKDLKIIIVLRNPADRAWSHFIMKRRDEVEPLEDFRTAINPGVIDRRINENKGCDLDYIGNGMFYERVNAFIEEFQKVNVIFHEDLSTEGERVVREIFDFLGVDSGFIPDMGTRYNVSGKAKVKSLNTLLSKKQYPLKGLLKSLIPVEIRERLRYKIYEKNMRPDEMPEDIRRYLAGLYDDDIIKLQDLVKRDLSSWRALKTR